MSNQKGADLFNLRSHNPSYFSVKDSCTYKGTLIDFCIPVNLHFPPAEMLDLIRDSLSEILRYYPDYMDVHAKHIAALAGLSPETIVPCNGSTEIITKLCQQSNGPIVTSVPTFSRWTDLPNELHIPLCVIQRSRARHFRLDVEEIVDHCRKVNARTLVISNPNNPTGAWFTLDEIQELSYELNSLDSIIIDESFLDFADLKSAAKFAAGTNNMIVVKSMGKSLGWHGVRLGYAATNKERATRLRKELPLWNINGLAAFILKTVVSYQNEYFESFAKVATDRIYMMTQLSTVEGLTLFASKANFLFVELPTGCSGRHLRDRLLRNYGLLIRECSNKIGSSEQYLRLAVQRKDAVDSLVRALKAELTSTAIESKAVSAA